MAGAQPRSTTPMEKKRIVIIGGGFGGVKCAQTLRSRLRVGHAEIILFNKENHLVFSPLLADAVGSSLNLLDVIVPLRQMLPDVMCRTEEVQRLDLVNNGVEFFGHDGMSRKFTYDHLVIACGNISNLNVVPGMADHAFPLKTVGDAAVLRTHILEQMEKAEVCEDPARRRWYLSFVVVGGGFSGVETAGEINDLVRSSCRFYTNIQQEDISVTLIHSRDQLLPEISAPLREFARTKMERTGITMKLNARVMLATGEGVGLKEAFVHGGTIVCTIGSSIAPIVDRLDSPKENGRLLTEPDLRLRGSTTAWAIGDCARIVNGYDHQPSPATGQFAERQGRQCADNIVRTLRGEPTRPFSFRVLGQLCSIGGHSAVAEMFGLKLSGFIAWFVWRGVYLFKLPSLSRRMQVGFDWAWLLIFPRDLSCLKTDTTDRVSHAHYEAGDFVIKQGDAPDSFYVIEKGEVDIVRTSPEKPDGEIIAVLGPGSFFGEAALINQQPRSASVRARTELEVVVMGRHVFTTISETLAPLKDAVTQAISRRSTSSWVHQPGAMATLRGLVLADFVEPPPTPLLAPTAPLGAVMQVFAENPSDFFYVSCDGVKLAGVVTLADIMRAQAANAPLESPVASIMTKDPVAITQADTCVVAAAAFCESSANFLPVVADQSSGRIVGFIRARKLLAAALPRMAKASVPPC